MAHAHEKQNEVQIAQQRINNMKYCVISLKPMSTTQDLVFIMYLDFPSSQTTGENNKSINIQFVLDGEKYISLNVEFKRLIESLDVGLFYTHEPKERFNIIRKILLDNEITFPVIPVAAKSIPIRELMKKPLQERPIAQIPVEEPDQQNETKSMVDRADLESLVLSDEKLFIDIGYEKLADLNTDELDEIINRVSRLADLSEIINRNAPLSDEEKEAMNLKPLFARQKYLHYQLVAKIIENVRALRAQ